MHNHKDLLPRNKQDYERVSRIKNLSERGIVPLIPDLITWLQDMNWPIARDISQMLLKVSEQTIPHIKNVLTTNDHIWKYWCLSYLVMNFPNDLIKEIEPELNRLAYSPTKGEVNEEVHEVAQQILKKLL
ncbi:DUF5071 domain-containing protein [Paenibacillus guangzhouensis]|uniref:DUF5071 domain-containing protein n=1 Tax=Paenibacillus guangzhouensis TaxID=1473112 RepID=UPI001266BC6F|nr:DUF5071 domain-containing protein [Paenibacillus guangzhouensis]